MDRQWMYGGRNTMAWIVGLDVFLNAAEATRSTNGLMCCPCRICRNVKQVRKGILYTFT